MKNIFLTVILTALSLQAAPLPKEVVKGSENEIVNKSYMVRWGGYDYSYIFSTDGSYKWKVDNSKEWQRGSYVWNSDKRVLLLWEEDKRFGYQCKFYILDLFSGGLTGKIRFSEALGFYSTNNCSVTFKGE